jgi:hypothetical protein
MALEGLFKGGEGDFRLEYADRHVDLSLIEPDFFKAGRKTAIRFIGIQKRLQGLQSLADSRLQGRFVLRC